MGHLKKREFQMTSRCPLCGLAKEDLNHLLIHCPSIWGLWEGLISTPCLDWVCPFLAKDLLLGWIGFPIRQEVVNGGAPLPILGNLEADEPNCF